MTVIKSFEPPAETTELESSISSIKGPLIVIIRHGKTEHNKLGLFTGWEDAPLAAEGDAQQLYHSVLNIIYTVWSLNLSSLFDSIFSIVYFIDLLI